jgi:hypothetical protein
LTTLSKEALERAERNFKKEMQAREASKAMAEYEARMQAEREKTARLRLLREAKEAADAAARAAAKAAGGASAKDAPGAKSNKVAARKMPAPGKRTAKRAAAG